MSPRKFFGATSREVLQKVKQALGDDALIVSNRPVNGGIEITALAADALMAAQGVPADAFGAAAPGARPVMHADLFAASRGMAPPPVAPARAVPQQPEWAPPAAPAQPVLAMPAPTSAPARAVRTAPNPTAEEPEGLVHHLMRELNVMKALMQRELSGIQWSDLKHRAPVHAATMQALLDSGFSPALARELITTIPEHPTAAAARKTIDGQIERRLAVAGAEAAVEQGGVYALVGPTGVGKTTTVAKLAARCVVRNGAQSLALLTTDSYRIAGHDQLRIYGKILGVPVHAIKDAEDLQATLADLAGKKTVLIDTIGMSQRDRLVAEQSALLAGGGPVKRLLLLNSTANAATLDEVVSAYAPNGVHGCIITKVDESAAVATALDAAIRHRLELHYVTNGQRVPEDLHLPNRTYLLHRALQAIKDTATHSLRPEEYPLVMGPALGAAHG